MPVVWMVWSLGLIHGKYILQGSKCRLNSLNSQAFNSQTKKLATTSQSRLYYKTTHLNPGHRVSESLSLYANGPQ
jgi:hypothetical protein